MASLSPLLESLRRKLAQGRKVPNGCTRAWEQWLDTWSDMSVQAFLCSNPLTDLQPRFSDSENDILFQLHQLLPWTKGAIAAQSMCRIPFPWHWSVTFVIFYCINDFWLDPMHTFEGGLQAFAEKFLERNPNGWNREVELNQSLRLGICVRKIHYDDQSVVVTAFDNKTQAEVEITGDAVIVTTPIVNLLQIEFIPSLPPEYRNGISAFRLTSTCKVLLQCKTRFWEKDGINGGASRLIKSTITLQLVYPSVAESDLEGQTKGGILMCYIWPPFANRYASVCEEEILKEMVHEISSIHPEIGSEYEQGTVCHFSNAFTVNEPISYLKGSKLMNRSINKRMYLAGEWLSWIPGWIEGALQSGLRAAFQFYIYNEQ